MDFAVAGVDHQPFVIRLVDQNLQQLFPHTLVAPADKPVVGVAPAPIVRWRVAPWYARSDDPENRVDEQPIVFRYAATDTGAARQMRLQQCPCFIG